MFSPIVPSFTRRTPPDHLRKYFQYSEIDWGILNPSEVAVIDGNRSIINLQKKEILFGDGNTTQGVFKVIKGRIKLFIRMPDGAEQIVLIYSVGESFGFRHLLAEENNSTAIASALETSQVEFIPANLFMEVLSKSPQLNQHLLTLLCRESTIWSNRMAFVAQKDVKQKIALTLLLLNERFKLANSIVKTASIHISKTDLSSMIGSSLETVIRALKSFQMNRLLV